MPGGVSEGKKCVHPATNVHLLSVRSFHCLQFIHSIGGSAAPSHAIRQGYMGPSDDIGIDINGDAPKQRLMGGGASRNQGKTPFLPENLLEDTGGLLRPSSEGR